MSGRSSTRAAIQRAGIGPNRPSLVLPVMTATRSGASGMRWTVFAQVHLRSRGSLDRMQLELSIGAVSERTGVAPSALRFYEAEGLIHATRSDGGQRRYTRDTLRRVSFIRVAQQVGLRLDEIRGALESLPENRTPTEKDWERLSNSW